MELNELHSSRACQRNGRASVTRSDWPLAQRIELEQSSAVRQLWLTRRLCELVLIALELGRANVELLMEQVAMRVALLLPQGLVEARLQLLRQEAARDDG
jgi:hypothetical protein